MTEEQKNEETLSAQKATAEDILSKVDQPVTMNAAMLLQRKPTYNREKFLAEEFRRGGQKVNAPDQSKRDMDSFIEKLKEEIRETERQSASITVTDTNSSTLNRIGINQPSVIQSNVSSKSKRFASLSPGSLSGKVNTIQISAKPTFAAEALKQFNDSFSQNKISNITSQMGQKSKAALELEKMKYQDKKTLPEIELGSFNLKNKEVMPNQSKVKSDVSDLSSIFEQIRNQMEQNEAKEGRSR